MWRRQQEEPMRCSFCHKGQDTVGRLISSPSDYPRAYICDECIAVCASIIEDDPQRPGPPVAPTTPPRHRFQDFPQAAEFFDAVEDWIGCEPESPEAAEHLERMRAIANEMVDFPRADQIFTTRSPK
jgi:hypothetical protein